MKKLISYCFIALLLYCFIGFILPSPALAQTYPPLGTNIAANFDYANLEWIASHANCTGPIPITVIITPQLVQDTGLLMTLQGYLNDLGFDPTWRPWGFVDPSNTTEMNAWINAFSLLEIGQLQTWNEWNRYTEVPDILPERDAQVLLALINARNAGLISIPLGNTPLDLLNVSDMTYQEYWTDLNIALTNLGCPDCLNQLDFIVSNVYAPGQYSANSVDEFLQVWQGELDFLRGLGVDLSGKFFIISEAGLAPGAYRDFNQRLQDTLLFAQALEAAILADPSRFPGLDQITFLLMDDTGKQYLIYRDCTGDVCVWKVVEYLVFNNLVPGPILPPGIEALTCNYASGGDTDSRPAPCDPCNSTLKFCPSCATSFRVGTTVGWQWRDKDCENGGIWVIKKWEGEVAIDPTETTIPFVGKKENESEKFYLADYFEGTTEYYKINEYPRYWLDWIDHAGVWRKLTPMGYQDILKEEMVEKAVTATAELHEGNIHNYNLEYVGRTCWDLPFLAHAFAIFIDNMDIPGISAVLGVVADKAHYCVFDPNNNDANLALDIYNAIIDSFHLPSFLKIPHRYTPSEDAQLASLDGHFPPQPDEENYVEKWQAWKKTPEGRLWEVTPMFSRENTPGMIYPYFGWKPMDIPQYGYIEPRIEKVPHVARLYEGTQETQRMLFPYTSGMGRGQEESGSTFASSSQPIIASPAEEKVQGEKTLLAQGPGVICYPENCKVLAPDPVIGCGCVAAGTCMGEHYGCGGHLYGGCICGYTDCGPPTGVVCCKPACSDATGGPAEPPPFTCELPLAFEVPSCAMDSITDENPNDPICGEPPDCEKCKPIEVDVVYYDSFNDYPYTECTPECGCCGVPCCADYPPGMEPPDCSNKKCVCDDDPCLNWEHRVVNRGWGINLIHPYLTEIWEQTAKNKTKGLFNIFRPFEIPEFEELDAHSTIDYNFTGGWERPSDGKFYFNYLGGIQKAKEWVTTKELMPYIE